MGICVIHNKEEPCKTCADLAIRPRPRPKGPRFKKSMVTKYAKEWGSNKCGSTAKSKITDKKTKYLRLGYQQNPRKVEMAKCGAATTKKRGTTIESAPKYLS